MTKLALDYSLPQTLRLKLSGDWRTSAGFPQLSEITSQLASHKDIRQITFHTTEPIYWDSGLIALLLELVRYCQHNNINVDRQGLPHGLQKLLSFALTADEKTAPPKQPAEPFLEKVADRALGIIENGQALLDFLGQLTVSFLRLIAGKADFGRKDFTFIIQASGASALPLVSLISILVGIILAFVGAIQLKLFGAQIFIADVVGIGMVRVMGAVMTGVLMAGRTGASFAAELGIMQVNDEIDAFKTFGISPVEFLVMPRLLALIIMMPLLTIYSDFMGIVGGFMVSVATLGLNPVEYLNHTRSAVTLAHLSVGLIHSFVFGIIIAVAGCFCGIRCARSSSGVGEATTSAVVSGITAIVIATAIITFICQVLGV